MSNERAQFFTRVFTDRLWGSEESASGQGSTMAAAQQVVDALPGVLRQLNVRTLVDAPCGDFNWMKAVDLAGIDYLGVDIVPGIAAQNAARYSKAGVRFEVMDLVEDPLPGVDMIFVRDCFIHFSLALIQAALCNFRRSGIKYLCVTHDNCVERYASNHHRNIDLDRTVQGVNFEYRPLNFQLPPFDFPQPLHIIQDGSAWDGFKTMAVWDMASLPAIQE